MTARAQWPNETPAAWTVRDGCRLRPVACPLCGADDALLLYRDGNRREGLPVTASYVRCRRCDVIYLTPVAEHPERLYADVYLGKCTNGRLAGGRWRRRYDALLARCEARYDRSLVLHRAECGAAPGTILDVGCGDGARLAAYHAAGWQVWGVDLDPSAIRDAKNRGFGVFLQGELAAQNFPPETFDVVRMDNTLEHVLEPRAVIREIRRLLKPAGRLYLYVPNGESLTMRVLGRYSINSWIPFHVVLFTPTTIRRLLDEEGFDVSVGFNTPLGWLALTLKQLTSRRPFSSHPGLGVRTVACGLGPLARLADSLSMGEELVVKAIRRAS
ncbi:MAG TPA: class I SAM-dependent methyltransferase [Nitrospiria bacterium]|nr:class I SAM-dependent methyltransferase [Nitrospiria bacterium]